LPKPIKIVAHFLAGSLLQLMMWWLEEGMPYSPQRMEEIFQELTQPGVWAALHGKTRDGEENAKTQS